MTPEIIRNRYQKGHYEVAGKLVAVDRIKVRSMNFGQPWRGEEVENIAYEIKLHLQLATDIINWQLPDYVADARQFPDEQNLLDRLLAESGWISNAEQLMKTGSELLRQMVLEEYVHEMISQWFGDGQLSKDGYVLNSCNEVGLENEFIIIKGYCRNTASSSAYQDF